MILAKFVVTGGGAALVFLLLCYGFAAAGLPAFPATVAAYAIGFALGYSLQRNWTFGGRHRHDRAFPRYLALQAACALLSGAVSHVAVADFGMAPLPMALVTTGLAGAASFVGSKFWVFPHGATDRERSI